ncbi:MAG: hypothetical protein WC242_00735 [Candidatus Paceibacterota bacterium]|jgi:hypothetical protein
MKNWKNIALALITAGLFWLIKVQLSFPSADPGIVSVVLTIASILFGVLAGFFISELWSRYAEIRTTHSNRASFGLNMVKLAEHFYMNEKFKKEFTRLVEKSSIADEVVEWDEGDLELEYYRDIAESFKCINLENSKSKTEDEIYLSRLLENYEGFVSSTIKLETLGKERLFVSEWFVLYALSFVVALSLLFLDASNLFYKIIILIFPAVIAIALRIIYELDMMLWGKQTVSLEPNQKIFDAIGVLRFYLKKKRKFIDTKTKNYRTEEDLSKELKEVYNNVTESRK